MPDLLTAAEGLLGLTGNSVTLCPMRSRA